MKLNCGICGDVEADSLRDHWHLKHPAKRVVEDLEAKLSGAYQIISRQERLSDDTIHRRNFAIVGHGARRFKPTTKIVEG